MDFGAILHVMDVIFVYLNDSNCLFVILSRKAIFSYIYPKVVIILRRGKHEPQSNSIIVGIVSTNCALIARVLIGPLIASILIIIGAATIIETVNQSDALQDVFAIPNDISVKCPSTNATATFDGGFTLAAEINHGTRDDQRNEMKVNSKRLKVNSKKISTGAYAQNSNSVNNNSVACVATRGRAGSGDTAGPNSLGKCASAHRGGVQQQHGYTQVLKDPSTIAENTMNNGINI